MPSATGPIALEDVATVEESEGPTSITTEGGQRTSTVTITPSTDDLATASASVTTALADADLPASADATLCGVVTQQQDAFTQLGLALLTVVFWWRYQHRPGADEAASGLNRRGSELVGRQFALHDAIIGGRGKIRVGDSLWLVSGPDLPAGAQVKVTGQDGAVLLVEPA